MSRKRRVGIVSYNMYGNFTNYGSALQSYALQTAINKLDPAGIHAIVVDYCPDILMDKDILNPMKNMWDTDPVLRENCRKSLDAIKENYNKFKSFYKTHYCLSSKKYTSTNFNESLNTEDLDGYVCGSDTVFAVPEFGFDDGFYANYSSMKHRSVAYAASFGDFDIEPTNQSELKEKLGNFKAIALRENDKMDVVKELYSGPLFKVIDPTLLLKASEYEDILKDPDIHEPYLLLYSRRNDPSMEAFAEKLAEESGLAIVEISLKATNADRHIMRYDAGVEEFLGLVKNASIVVTNSFHGMIFAVQFRRPFYIFSRKLCDTKIKEILDIFGIPDRFIESSNITFTKAESIDYDKVHSRISNQRNESIGILSKILDI